MVWVLLAHIGLPLLFGIGFVIINAAIEPRSGNWDVLAKTALDLTILSLGATGAIFDNARVEQAFGANSVLVAIAVIGVDFILAAVIVAMKSSNIRKAANFSLAGGILVLFVGSSSLGVTAGVMAWAYAHAHIG